MANNCIEGTIVSRPGYIAIKLDNSMAIIEIEKTAFSPDEPEHPVGQPVVLEVQKNKLKIIPKKE